MELVQSPDSRIWSEGAEFGRELAGALLLASERAGREREVTRQMAKIVLREIGAAVQKLRDASFPTAVVDLYERACRAGCREVLLPVVAREQGARRIAA